jgi:folate-binding protein YgfZ
VSVEIVTRERDFVGVAGPEAEDYLQRMVSNDVEALAEGESCAALLLTPKARVIAPVVVLRRGPDDFLLLTEGGLGEPVRAHLVRMRMRARCEIEPEQHTSSIVFGGQGGIPTSEFGEPAVELLDADLEPTLDAAELERRRIEAGTPAWGKEIDERVLPAEAGLTATHVSFTKGCYPGQEPVARLHHRGKANRTLRVLEVEAPEPPPYDAELSYEGKSVGRVTSVARRPDGALVGLAYVRVEVPEEATLSVEPSGSARGYTVSPARP